MRARAERPAAWAAVALLAAGLACGPALSGPDTVATVNAVSTRVEATLGADRTPAAPPPSLAPAATVTAPPPIQPASSTPSAPPAATATALLPTATATPLLRPNGALLAARRLASSPTIDGELGEWPDLPYSADQPVYRPENWSGPADLSARFALAWDNARLYVAAAVTDDVFVQTQRGEALFRGDSLEVLVDAALSSDFASPQLSGDDYQLGLSPGTAAGDAPEAFIWFPPAGERIPVSDETITVAARRTEAGYTLEAALPWLALRYLAPPATGWRMGFVLSVSDNDTPDTADQQCMVASVPGRRLTNPTTWGTLELGD